MQMMDPLARAEHAEYQVAVATLSGSLLRCAEKATSLGDVLPEHVRRHAQGKAWRAAAMLEQGSTGITGEGAAAVAHATTMLVESLLDFVAELQRQRFRDHEDMDEAIRSMQKWRAREEIQRGKVKELELAKATQESIVAQLEEQVAELRRKLELSRAEVERSMRVVTCQSLKQSRCTPLSNYDALIDDDLAKGNAEGSFIDAEQRVSVDKPFSFRSPRSLSLKSDSTVRTNRFDRQSFESSSCYSEHKSIEEEDSISVPSSELPIDPEVQAAVEKRLFRISSALRSKNALV